MKIFWCSVLLLTAAASLSRAETLVHLDEEEILYNGELTEEANEAVFDLYSKLDSKPHTLTITSPGGPIDSGLDLGEWVHRHGLNVKVYDLCFSSCANYVFPAGRKKLLDINALVGFHGGAGSETFDTSSIEVTLQKFPEKDREKLRAELEVSFKSFVQKNAERESQFYRELGVSPKLNTLGQSKPYRDLQENYDGWVYTHHGMTTLGLSNVEIIDDPRPAEQANKPKVFLLELAPESTLLAPVGLPISE